MTNKSRELCNLLGIEPKYKDYRTKKGKEYTKTECEAIRQAGNRNIREVWVDFEQPENFVKLLECGVKTFKGFLYEGKEDYLNWVLKVISSDNGDDYWKKQFKQQAQQVKWKY